MIAAEPASVHADLLEVRLRLRLIKEQVNELIDEADKLVIRQERLMRVTEVPPKPRRPVDSFKQFIALTVGAAIAGTALAMRGAPDVTYEQSVTTLLRSGKNEAALHVAKVHGDPARTGEALINLGRHAEAIAHLEGHDRPECLVQLGRAYLKTGDRARAEVAWRKASDAGSATGSDALKALLEGSI